MIKCAFYGTLRPPLYNYERIKRLFGISEVNYRKTVRIPGYEMYLVDPHYPGIKDSTKDKTIVVDLFEISPNAYDFVERMESYSGYYEDDIKIEEDLYKIFVYGSKIDGMLPIEDGDYLKYCNTSNNDYVSY